MPATAIRVAETADELRACFPVVRQLRPHVDEARFLELSQRMMAAEGFRVAFLSDEGAVVAVAGYRCMEMLFSNGCVLYVDDLVTDEGKRSRGYGKRLFDWLATEAKSRGCVALALDSGVQRFDAHRFYLAQRMHISSYHFRMEL